MLNSMQDRHRTTNLRGQLISIQFHKACHFLLSLGELRLKFLHAAKCSLLLYKSTQVCFKLANTTNISSSILLFTYQANLGSQTHLIHVSLGPSESTLQSVS